MASARVSVDSQVLIIICCTQLWHPQWFSPCTLQPSNIMCCTQLWHPKWFSPCTLDHQQDQDELEENMIWKWNSTHKVSKMINGILDEDSYEVGN